jgi:hypothetical protein
VEIGANPPFSQNYETENMERKDRFRYGWAPETGKKADLMFAQHVLAVLKPDGIGATVMPHGVLFRGGKEKDIRTGIINADRLEAVIGLRQTSSTAPASRPASWSCAAPTHAPLTARARSCSSTPTASSRPAARRTT